MSLIYGSGWGSGEMVNAIVLPGGDGTHTIRWHLDGGGLSEYHGSLGGRGPADSLGSFCGGYVRWKYMDKSENGWDVPKHHLVSGGMDECLELLTVTPSLLCVCGSHGFIHSGTWVDV